MSSPNETPLDAATIGSLLGDPVRRRLLIRLEPGERTTVSELARSLAARETRLDGGVDRSDRRRQIEVQLVHNHLPRLADHGLIAYVPDANGVVMTDDRAVLRRLERFLEQLVSDQ